MKKILVAGFAALTLLLAGCSSSSADTSPNNSEITQVIDVRNAAEYAAGHIEGAINIDVESSMFSSGIAGLDPKGVYLVYCHSGRRSAIAAQTMVDAGFTVLDGGGIDAMQSNGWQIGQ
ncbi:MAG: hypothetical protein RLZZ330_640 [Actinomycetota bacterium]|jgi:rhodanese-related sulfurtransferase